LYAALLLAWRTIELLSEDVFMSVLWKNHAVKLSKYVKENNDTQAHLYLEQLMLFPVDIQDKIIEEISQLPHCSNDAVASIIHQYSMFELR